MKAAIPVVFGGSSRRDYDLVAPPHSFIHVEDFDNVQSLADYLHYLATNSTSSDFLVCNSLRNLSTNSVLNTVFNWYVLLVVPL